MENVNGVERQARVPVRLANLAKPPKSNMRESTPSRSMNVMLLTIGSVCTVL